MMRLYGSLPTSGPLWVAISGGVDSMALSYFLEQSHRDRLHWVYVQHHTEYGKEVEQFLSEEAKRKQIPFTVRAIEGECPKGESLEAWWRNQRYGFFKECQGTVLTAHHLNDVMETWVWTNLHGEARLMPYQHENVIRPWLKVPKEKILDYAQRKGVQWKDDPSNQDCRFPRNQLRHEALPALFKAHPGFPSVVSRLLQQREAEEKMSLAEGPAQQQSGLPKRSPK